MAKGHSGDGAAMSPLARRLRALNDNGLSYREMERMALAQKIRYTSSSFEQVAKDQRADRLGIDALRALAVVLDTTPEQVAEWDDQRYGLDHVAYRETRESSITDVPDDVVIAEAAKRLAARNPERHK